MTDDERPEPDRHAHAPHPRMATRVLGHEAADRTFLDAVRSGRLHHAWLITGPRGVGKATLAWRLARFLLTLPPEDGGLFGAPEPPETTEVDADHPVAVRMRALSEPGLMLIRRGWDEKRKKLRDVITVEETRKLAGFFGLSAADGGRRVVIVDAADELNVNAANALLKHLEEPPARTTFLFVCHRPQRILPTIRSRCRELRLGELAPDAIAEILSAVGAEAADPARLAELAGGSAGDAVSLAAGGGLDLYAQLLALYGSRGLDRSAAIALADKAGARGQEARREMVIGLIALMLARAARMGAGRPPATEAAPGEAAILARLAPDARAARTIAALEADLARRAQHGLAVNLDPASLILDMLLAIAGTADRIAAAYEVP